MTSPEVISSPLSIPSTQPISSAIDPVSIRNIIDEAYHVKTDKQGRITPSVKQIGYELFVSRFEPCLLVDAFVAVIEQFPIVAVECPKYNSWWTPKFYHLIFLISQAFMSVLASELMPNKAKENDHKQNSFSPVHINVTDEQRCRILRSMVSLNFSFDSNFWNLTDYVLNFNKCPKNVVAIISSAALMGKASFAAVDYCIRSKVLSRYIDDPAILYFAALLGPLRASSVESFAAKRAEEFRRKCRDVLLRVEKLAGSSKEWECAIVNYLGSTKQNDLNGRVVAYAYAGFRDSFSTLMKDLRGLPPSDDRINIRWAHHLVRKCAAKYYYEKTWKIENLYEVIWTILAQRPSMRKFVVNTLSKNFKDPQAAEMWRICKIPSNARKHITHKSSLIQVLENILQQGRTSRSANAESPYLSIPESVEPIEFVQHPSHLRRVANLLEDYANDSFPPVGIDAEWSSYVSYSKATILQLAIPYHIFIIDIDGIKSDVLLRNAVQNCSALYHPKISYVLANLLNRNAKNDVTDCKENVEIKMNLASIDKMNKSDDIALTSSIEITGVKELNTLEHEQKTLEMENVEQNPLLKEIRGLSALCERVLDKPLDKTEQCSVWDRRPLRDLQLRYAALDAYCMLMLYEKCVDWASRFDLNINEICSKQEPLIGTGWLPSQATSSADHRCFTLLHHSAANFMFIHQL
ncbi:hypothetical protein DINM_003646 [Dirofilaria immitis]|nr:hypothetical protein [Dirofilaria immitis]